MENFTLTLTTLKEDTTTLKEDTTTLHQKN